MVANWSSHKKGWGLKDGKSSVTGLKKGESINAELVKLVDSDTKAFKPDQDMPFGVTEIYRRRERQYVQKLIQEATKICH
jgi:formiminotetrahydrofolate cyclodeaminase